MAGEPGENVAGIDAAAVSSWLRIHIADAIPPFSFELIAGGRSNLTYRVEDASGRCFVLRRPPMGNILPTAHDVAREYRIVRALAQTEVPVPITFGLCTDAAVNEAPFYVMDFAYGQILRDAEATAGFLTSERRVIGDQMADTLAALHAIDVDHVGLSTLGRHGGYVQRQLQRWTRQFTETVAGESPRRKLILDTAANFADRIPTQHDTSIVHGDYRLENMVLDEGGRIRAVLDWEICTLGDAMADVGLLLVHWAEVGDSDQFLDAPAPSSAEGFCTRNELLARYEATSGRNVEQVEYYMAFGYWKLACILEGVYARYRAGFGAGDFRSVDAFPNKIDRLLELAQLTLGR
jgi:aminoglycoside phosphotransferase (APT) family kinase protein